jgi:hypothetical protein
VYDHLHRAIAITVVSSARKRAETAVRIARDELKESVREKGFRDSRKDRAGEHTSQRCG